MQDILIIGGGYLGVALSVQLEAKGYKPVIMDDGDRFAGSRVSLGVHRDSWLIGRAFDRVRPEWWSGRHEETSLATVRDVFLSQEAYANDGSPILVQGDGWRNLWGRVQIQGAAEKILFRNGGCHVHYDGGKVESARAVILATGYRTDDLLRASGQCILGVGADKGQVIRFDRHEAYNGPEVTEVRPGERVYVLENRAGMTTPGGVSVVDVQGAIMSSDEYATVQGVEEGFYSYGPGGRLTVETIQENLLAVASGGRVGLAVAGGVAMEAVKRLKFEHGVTP